VIDGSEWDALLDLMRQSIEASEPPEGTPQNDADKPIWRLTITPGIGAQVTQDDGGTQDDDGPTYYRRYTAGEPQLEAPTDPNLRIMVSPGSGGEASESPPPQDDTKATPLHFFYDEQWKLFVRTIETPATQPRFWVFCAPSTNVEFTLKVTDEQGQRTGSADAGSAAISRVQAGRCGV